MRCASGAFVPILGCLTGLNLRKKRNVLLSAKISNSFFQYLEANSPQVLEVLATEVEFPEEFLRNPSSWLDAGTMESFLHLVVRYCGDIVPEVGHSSPSLRAWGVLDGVLRMMPDPQDLFMQPERILSYFVSPAPQIKNLRRDKDVISFEMPFSRNLHPISSQFLAAALESLPTYMGRPQAHIKWVDRYLEINCSQEQTELFNSEVVGQQYSPEFLQGLVTSLEASQKELEERNRELAQKNNQLVMAQRELKSKVEDSSKDSQQEIAEKLISQVNHPLALASNHLLRLSDYLARAQQLVTLLVGQDRSNPQVKEAMKRMDWVFITQEYPRLVQEAIDEISKARQLVGKASDQTNGVEPVRRKNEGENVSKSQMASATGRAMPQIGL